MGERTRREVARSLLRAGAAIALGSRFGPLEPGLARAAAVRTKTRLVAEVSWQGATNYVGMPKELTERFIDEQWTSSHPGVEVETLGWRGDPAFLGSSGAIGAILGGGGPDIVMNCCDGVPALMYSGVLAPIDPYLRQENIDATKLFPSQLLVDLADEEGLMGLPDYGSIGPLFINLSMFDELGLAYPAPDWTYLQAEHTWRALAGQRKGQWVYGMDFRDNGSAFEWLVRAWGGSVYDSTHTRCLLDSPESVAAHQWFVPMFVDKVATNTLGVDSGIVSGQTAFMVGCCGSLQGAVLQFANKFKWDIHPVPTYPHGIGTYDGIGIYGINRLSKNPPELVWDLYKFITMSPQWQRYFNARLAFMPPSMSAPELWDDWLTIVRSVAPVLRDKHMEYYQQSMPGGYWRAYFRYQSLQAEALWVQYQGLMQSGKISVVEGLHQLTERINAMEEVGARSAASQHQQLARIEPLLAAAATTKTTVTFPPPARAGAGLPYRPAGNLVRALPGSALQVAGAGSMAGGLRDDVTFACAATRQSRATFSCRLVSIAAPGGTLKGGAKVGLMVRADLSDNTPMVSLDIDGPNGLHVDRRPLPGLTQGHQRGLIAQSLVSSSSKPVANWLLKPLWLRWVRDDSEWTAYTSWDGTTYARAGAVNPGIEMAAGWVGLFVCSNDAPHSVVATFDHLQGFAPDTFVVLGAG